jgi:hypothetical protein
VIPSVLQHVVEDIESITESTSQLLDAAEVGLMADAGCTVLSWENTTTYGAIGPLWFGRGKDALHKERRAQNSTTAITRAVFT